MPYDRWAILDMLSALMTVVGFPIIMQMSPESFADKDSKDWIDILMLTMIFLQWMRFYLFFFMLEELSKMLLTFLAMIVATAPFMFIVIAYLIIAAAVFTTIFQDVNYALYGNFVISIRSMFDGLMGGYSYKGFGEYEMMHMLMMWVHIILANVLLLNYLIALLSQSYCEMLESGKFLYNVYLYQYCERYVVGLANQEYGQLVIHPAPVVVLNFPIALLAITPCVPDWVLVNISYGFALFMFWLENIAWLALFFIYEVVLIPLVYFKNIFVVAIASQGYLKKIGGTIAWLLIGPFCILFWIFSDVSNMFMILTMH